MWVSPADWKKYQQLITDHTWRHSIFGKLQQLPQSSPDLFSKSILIYLGDEGITFSNEQKENDWQEVLLEAFLADLYNEMYSEMAPAAAPLHIPEDKQEEDSSSQEEDSSTEEDSSSEENPDSLQTKDRIEKEIIAPLLESFPQGTKADGFLRTCFFLDLIAMLLSYDENGLAFHAMLKKWLAAAVQAHLPTTIFPKESLKDLEKNLYARLKKEHDSLHRSLTNKKISTISKPERAYFVSDNNRKSVENFVIPPLKTLIFIQKKVISRGSKIILMPEFYCRKGTTTTKERIKNILIKEAKLFARFIAEAPYTGNIVAMAYLFLKENHPELDITHKKPQQNYDPIDTNTLHFYQQENCLYPEKFISEGLVKADGFKFSLAIPGEGIKEIGSQAPSKPQIPNDKKLNSLLDPHNIIDLSEQLASLKKLTPSDVWKRAENGEIAQNSNEENSEANRQKRKHTETELNTEKTATLPPRKSNPFWNKPSETQTEPSLNPSSGFKLI